MLNDFSPDVMWKKLSPFCKLASEITPMEIIPDNKKTYEKCLGVLRTFFTKGSGLKERSPFKGFLFEGMPGTGKTELVRQIAKGISPTVPNTHLLFVDGATIATPKWGDAENTLKSVFRAYDFLGKDQKVKDQKVKDQKVKAQKVMVLFDDIESLMLARTSEIAKEWHYSINAVLFHELDAVNPGETFVFATTNKPDLVDDALRDRLYSIKFELPSMESLIEITKGLLKDSGDISERIQIDILKAVKKKLKEKESPTIRDVGREVTVQCMERGAW